MSSPRSFSVSEVPHWDNASRSLYFINIDGVDSTINRYDYDEDQTYSARIDNTPNLLFIIPTDCGRDQFLVGVNNQGVLVKWDGRSEKAQLMNQTVFTLDPGTANVVNDVKTDQCGRFYCGTKSVPECGQSGYTDGKLGGFYVFESDFRGKSSDFFISNDKKALKQLRPNVYISNGLTWVRSTNKFYYVDSCQYNVMQYNYNPKTGKISK